jgi:hypothetical protein
MEYVCIFDDHLEYFMDIWYNLWLFGIVCGDLVYFSHFGMLGPRKIWQPCTAPHHSSSTDFNLFPPLPPVSPARKLF